MKSILDKYPVETIEKAKSVKVIITDIDGVMTDGRIIYDDNGLEYKNFFVRDGQIMRFLREAGIKVGAITGRESPVVKNRCEELGFDFHYHGAKDKIAVWEEIMNKYGFSEVNVAYIGDDLLDMPLFARSGFSATPADAPDYVKEKADLVLNTNSGKGVFREFGDLILAAQDQWELIYKKLEI
ncbi:MAG: KdsC family phosphatase [Candidatus Cyclobacteriaceae bacterium M2_1C_046]